MRVGLSGLAWQKIVKAGLLHGLWKQLPFVQGGEPFEDDALMAVVKEMCLSHKRHLAEEQAKGNLGGNSNTNDGGSGHNGKGKKCK